VFLLAYLYDLANFCCFLSTCDENGLLIEYNTTQALQLSLQNGNLGGLNMITHTILLIATVVEFGLI